MVLTQYWRITGTVPVQPLVYCRSVGVAKVVLPTCRCYASQGSTDPPGNTLRASMAAHTQIQSRPVIRCLFLVVVIVVVFVVVVVVGVAVVVVAVVPVVCCLVVCVLCCVVVCCLLVAGCLWL